MLAATKYWRQQNIGTYKILALTKYWRRQNIDVNKIFESTKYWRQQNLGVDKMLAHAREHFLTVLPRQSLQQLTSPRPRWCSPTSPRRCWSLHMQSPSVLLPLAALLLWADSLPHCTSLLCRPAMQKMSQLLASTKNIGSCQDFTNFSQTIAVNISAHRRHIKNWWKQKVITLTVQYQFTYSWPPNWSRHIDPMLRSLSVQKGYGWQGGGGGSLLYLFHLPRWIASGYAIARSLHPGHFSSTTFRQSLSLSPPPSVSQQAGWGSMKKSALDARNTTM